MQLPEEDSPLKETQKKCSREVVKTNKQRKKKRDTKSEIRDIAVGKILVSGQSLRNRVKLPDSLPSQHQTS